MAVRKNKPYFEFLRKLMFLRVNCSISLSFACGLQGVEKNYCSVQANMKLW
jgi:hypothetical protein